MRAHGELEGEPRHEERDRGDGHGRQGAANDGADEGPQGEREQRIRDGRQTPLAEVGRPDAVAVGVERQGPPREQGGEHRGRREGEQREHGNPGSQPAPSCHALRPRQAMRAQLELAGEQGSTPERADGGGHPDEDRPEQLEGLVERRQVLFGSRHDVAPGGEKDGGDGCGRDERDQRLAPGLSPGEPGHDRTAASCRGAAAEAEPAM